MYWWEKKLMQHEKSFRKRNTWKILLKVLKSLFEWK